MSAHPQDRGACDLDADPCDGCAAADAEVWPEREQPEPAVFVWTEEDDDDPIAR